MKIGNRNLFQVGCIVQCNCIGDLNIFEVKSKVGKEVLSIGSGCVIGAATELTGSPSCGLPNDIDNDSVIYRCDNEVRLRSKCNLTRQNNHHISQYLNVLKDEKSTSALQKHHKLRPSNNVH